LSGAGTPPPDPGEGPARHRGAGKRVWVFSELFYPEETSTGHIMTDLAEGLARHYPTLAVCGQPTYSARGRRAPSRETNAGVRILRCSGTTFDKDSLPGKLLNMLTLGVSMFAHALFRLRAGDVALVVTNPPVLPFLVLFACLARRARCAVIVHDVYPETLVAAGLLRAGSWPARLLNGLNRWLYRRAAVVTVLGRDMERLVLKKLAIEESDRVFVVPNWADDLRPASRESSALLKDLGLETAFVVQYAGNMGRNHGIESLFETAARLNQREHDVHFLFIGSGAKRRWLEESVRKAGLTNVTILAPRPREEQQDFLNACDVSISALRPGMAGVGVPSRMYNVMAVGRPMIAAVEEDSEQAMVILEEGVGWVVPPEDPGSLVDAILAARSDPERLREMALRARSAVERKYRRDNAIETYRRLIDREANAFG
jgi:glycosyltransferase involved in cell wall biosynthesis